jgi:ribonucleoside-diphosphate reductase alpha chain
LNHVSRNSSLESAPTIEQGNRKNRAVGLGAMNLHGFLATNKIYYNSPEAVDFTNMFFYVMAYHAFKASNKLVETFGKFDKFEKTTFADGKYFEKYTKCDPLK